MPLCIFPKYFIVAGQSLLNLIIGRTVSIEIHLLVLENYFGSPPIPSCQDPQYEDNTHDGENLLAQRFILQWLLLLILVAVGAPTGGRDPIKAVGLLRAFTHRIYYEQMLIGCP